MAEKTWNSPGFLVPGLCASVVCLEPSRSLVVGSREQEISFDYSVSGLLVTEIKAGSILWSSGTDTALPVPMIQPAWSWFPFCGNSQPCPCRLPSKELGPLNFPAPFRHRAFGSPCPVTGTDPQIPVIPLPRIEPSPQFLSLLCQLFPPGSWQVGFASCGHVLSSMC